METEVKKQTGEVTNNQVNVGSGFKPNRGQTDHITHRSIPKHRTDKRVLAQKRNTTRTRCST